MRLLITGTFEKVTKKLHGSQKVKLAGAMKLICKAPSIGVTKLRDLPGVYGYKFRLSQQQYLCDYRILNEESIKLLTFGRQEDFYRDLMRQGK